MSNEYLQQIFDITYSQYKLFSSYNKLVESGNMRPPHSHCHCT